MRLGVIPESAFERLALALGLVPTPLMDTLIAMLLARTVMVATKVGVFEAMAAAPLSSSEIAARCRTDPAATETLLDALVGADYLRRFDKNRYSLAPAARKWLLKDSAVSLHDNMLFRFLEWEIAGTYEEFIRTGVPLDIHRNITSGRNWGIYQRGLRSLSAITGAEVARRTPVPSAARDLLDIGGSHGYNSVVLCRRHPRLRAVVLDLPDAIAQAAPILAAERMGDRIVHRAGNALTDDLGTEAWDVVFIAQLVHHFDDAQNRELARRVARALRPGGVFVIQDVIRTASTRTLQTGGLLHLFFAVTSQANTWSYEQMADWQRQAGLQPAKPIRFRTLPGIGQQASVKR